MQIHFGTYPTHTFNQVANADIRHSDIIEVNINNLADKDYIATCLARGDCWFGPRRKAVVTAASSA
mgnify:CR=1 FL=1